MEALGMTDAVEPRPLIETDGIHDQRVSIPLRDRMSVPRRAEILQILTGRQLAAVGPEVSDSMFPLEDLQDLVFRHDEFKRLIVIHQPWKTLRVTFKPGRV